MSQLAINDKKKAADRKNAAMRMNYTKVKPTVVKHVLQNEVMHLHDPSMHQDQFYLKTAENIHARGPTHQMQLSQLTGGGFTQTTDRSEGQQSLRYQPGKSGNPQQDARDLIDQLKKGMGGLTHLQGNMFSDNSNPNLQGEAMEMLQKMRQAHSVNAPAQAEATQPGTHRSIYSGVTYNNSAVGEMQMNELDELLEKNEQRIERIKEKFNLKRSDIKSYHEVLVEQKETFEVKEHFKDNSLSYPSYGRGLQPNINMDTFMIQESMCGTQKKKISGGEHLELSPQVSVQAAQRKKILSPKRQKFENNFEKHMHERYVEKPISAIPEQLSQMEQPPPFDTTTRYEGSLNKNVEKRKAELEFLEGRKKVQGVARSLGIIEKEAQELIEGEHVINMRHEMTEALRRVFQESKFRKEEHLDHVELEEFFYNICHDESYLGRRLEDVVRETTDMERETLDALLLRVSKEHKDERITWDAFIVNFTKRGKLRPGEEIAFSGFAIADIDTARAETQRFENEDPEEVQWRMQRALKEQLVYKQNMVPKGGKGKYDITVPEPFSMCKKSNVPKKTIRQAWLEEDAKKKKEEEDRYRAMNFKANEIPKSTSQPLYQHILKKEEKRRTKNKEASMAKTKATEKPFSFHERDLQAARDSLNLAGDIDEHMLAQFRARIVPYKILVPRYKMMVEKEEYDREQRIRQNAEKSLQAAKLPPRMQQHEDERRRRIEEDLDTTKGTQQTELLFNFQPPRARSVPNFRKIQKEFTTKMEALKKSKAPTVPKPFNFHQPKPAAHLRQYMDQANQDINPTMKPPRRSMSVKAHMTRNANAEQPSTTKKHEAYVAMRRQQMEEKKQSQENKFQEEIERYIKQNRLQQRVKCSPALVSNTAALKRKRQVSKAIAAKKMTTNAKTYEKTKQEIEFKVANRPLLVEQVSKAFIHNLNQIKELQHFVTLLREAGHNPDEHLTDEQRELLISAEYYDRLNVATAYFPAQNGGQALMQEGGPGLQQQMVEGHEQMDPNMMMEGATDQIQEDIDEEDEMEGEDEDQEQAEGEGNEDQPEDGEEDGEGNGQDEDEEEDAYNQMAMQQQQQMLSEQDIANFNELDPQQQAAIAQALQQQQQHMYQVDQDGMEEEEDGDEDEVDIEYDGIEGMEQQIEEEDDGEEADLQQRQMMQVQEDGDMMDGEEEEDQDQGEEEQMMGEGEDQDEDDDMIEIDEEQLRQLIMQQQQMAIQGEGMDQDEMDEDDEDEN